MSNHKNRELTSCSVYSKSIKIKFKCPGRKSPHSTVLTQVFSESEHNPYGKPNHFLLVEVINVFLTVSGNAKTVRTMIYSTQSTI